MCSAAVGCRSTEDRKRPKICQEYNQEQKREWPQASIPGEWLQDGFGKPEKDAGMLLHVLPSCPVRQRLWHAARKPRKASGRHRGLSKYWRTTRPPASEDTANYQTVRVTKDSSNLQRHRIQWLGRPWSRERASFPVRYGTLTGQESEEREVDGDAFLHCRCPWGTTE